MTPDSKPSGLPRTFVDDSTECAICFDAFAEDPRRPRITLRCGHTWHLDCIARQIEVGSMTAHNDDQRLLFHACQCGKCGAVFGEDDHPDLPRDALRSTDKLRRRVDALIDEHGLREGGAAGPAEARYKEARRRYAFYLCGHCQNPYFGGTVACADGAPTAARDEGGGGARRPRETRLCPACAPQAQVVCRNPSEHGRFLAWKCRYCCRPSTTVCYGNVHFCEGCHAKNSTSGGAVAVPCPGSGRCKHPKPPPRPLEEDAGDDDNGDWFHSNGPSPDCEQVYSCALCESLGGEANAAGDPLAIEAGSRNFLANSSGQDGLRGWKQLNPHMSWKVEGPGERERQAIPPLLQTPCHDTTAHGRPAVTTNFVSSFGNCAMAQTVDLTKVLRIGRSHRNRGGRDGIPQTIRVEVSARYTGRTDCPSVFALQAILSDGTSPNPREPRATRPRRDAPPPPQRLSSGTLQAPPGVYWERAALEFVIDTAAQRYHRPTVTVIVMGKDQRFWQGNFGSKVADVTVRVVGATPAELEALSVTRNTPGVGGGTNNDEVVANHREIDATRQEDNKSVPSLVMVVLLGVWLSWWWHNSDGS